ncbi:endonuclease/exonuclease/phosphatase family protein [Streptomyces sp. AC563]|uniref:endonuclease/exonuclease/phosphatase family protein n=1 Tax=Streptomyces buecherae TaxID=2763006 RepID=UPI00164E6BDA|nr:endonuclease/exonuclease/phosphatase family protein [Streptomyces buecherae]MBC3990401.1 endonuclease/exonuclease/phosphatase family protein [Streptomyces buecherae]
MSDETLVVASWNVAHNGRGDGDVLDGNHIHDARRYLASKRPDIVFRQELTGAWDEGQLNLFAEANALGGLFPHMARPQHGKSRNPPGLMVSTRHLVIDQTADAELPWRAISGLRVRLKGCAKTLHLASAHLTSFDPALRATEARWLTRLADHGRTALIGMDANSYPHRAGDETTTPIDWGAVADRVHFQHRTTANGVPDTKPSSILTAGPHGQDGVFTDLGHYAGTTLEQPNALKATASLWRTDQGPPQRIDWLLATPDLLPALTAVEVVDSPEVRHVSDHALVLATFSLPDLRRLLA